MAIKRHFFRMASIAAAFLLTPKLTVGWELLGCHANQPSFLSADPAASTCVRGRDSLTKDKCITDPTWA
uniref:Putative 5'-nucleotidase/apyrase n=1 Tax=Ixodes ricinus TaxID=34613 RepID=A0A0K8R781_IXORI